jgi:hypothetical protein
VETRLKGFRSSPQASFAYAFGFCLKKKKGRVEPSIWRKCNRWDDNKADNSVKRFFRLAHFCGCLSCGKASLWPGSRGVARKKHRREKNSTRRSPVLPQNEAGPSGVTQFGIRNFYFFFSIPHSAIDIPHLNCPPGPGNEARLMVFSRNAPASGPGNQNAECGMGNGEKEAKYQFSRLKIISPCGGISLSTRWNQGARFSMPLTCKIS